MKSLQGEPAEGRQIAYLTRARPQGAFEKGDDFPYPFEISKLEEMRQFYSDEYVYRIVGYPGDLASFIQSDDFQQKLKKTISDVKIEGKTRQEHSIYPSAEWGGGTSRVLLEFDVTGSYPRSTWSYVSAEDLDDSGELIETGRLRSDTDIELDSQWCELVESVADGSWTTLAENRSQLSRQGVKVSLERPWVIVRARPDSEEDDLYWFVGGSGRVVRLCEQPFFR